MQLLCAGADRLHKAIIAGNISQLATWFATESKFYYREAINNYCSYEPRRTALQTAVRATYLDIGTQNAIVELLVRNGANNNLLELPDPTEGSSWPTHDKMKALDGACKLLKTDIKYEQIYHWCLKASQAPHK